MLDKKIQAAMEAHRRLSNYYKKIAYSDSPKAKKSKIKYFYHINCMNSVARKNRKLTKAEKKLEMVWAKRLFR